MASYYGYAEREADSQIDWSAVGKQFVDVLQDEAKIRAEKKQAIDDASREMANTLQNAPTGDNLTMNQFTLDYAADAQALLLQQDRLLKAGILKPKDYAVVRANLNDSTDQLFNLSKEYQSEYADKMARWEGDESSFIEVWEMEQAEGLSNIKNGKALINPNTGVVSVGTWKDGKMDTDPSSYATVNELRNRLKAKTDRFKADEVVATSIDKLGKNQWVDIIEAAGGGKLNQVLTNVDATQKEEYAAWEKNAIQSMLPNQRDKASLLIDNLVNTPGGTKYTLTYDEDEFKNDKTGSVIFMDRSDGGPGTPKFSKEQEKVIEETMRNKIRQQLDKTVEARVSEKSYYRPTAVDVATRKGKDDAKKAVTMMNQLYYGDAEQIAAAETYFRGSLAAQEVRRTNEGVEITTGAGDVITVPFGTGTGDDFQEFSFTEFVQSAGPDLAGNLDITEAVRLSGGFQDMELTQEMIDENPTLYADKKVGDRVPKPRSTVEGSGAGVDRALTPQQITDAEISEVRTFVRSNIDAKDFTDGDEDDVVQKLTEQFGGLGFKFEVDWAGKDAIKVIAPDGTELPDVRLDQGTGGPQQASDLAQFINSKITNEQATNYYDILLESNKVKTINPRGKGELD